eukprot:comp22118_c0_seq1/m.51553 comp22118_c0_seq1/g.51553  ORF comp22118_c0_seq1/g.51553 comp22118_c0_seq1/m.51553 type:complete len:486 (-) comp22118_c0_seq1:18-1475(-)
MSRRRTAGSALFTGCAKRPAQSALCHLRSHSHRRKSRIHQRHNRPPSHGEPKQRKEMCHNAHLLPSIQVLQHLRPDRGPFAPCSCHNSNLRKRPHRTNNGNQTPGLPAHSHGAPQRLLQAPAGRMPARHLQHSRQLHIPARRMGKLHPFQRFPLLAMSPRLQLKLHPLPALLEQRPGHPGAQTHHKGQPRRMDQGPLWRAPGRRVPRDNQHHQELTHNARDPAQRRRSREPHPCALVRDPNAVPRTQLWHPQNIQSVAAAPGDLARALLSAVSLLCLLVRQAGHSVLVLQRKRGHGRQEPDLRRRHRDLQHPSTHRRAAQGAHRRQQAALPPRQCVQHYQARPSQLARGQHVQQREHPRLGRIHETSRLLQRVLLHHSAQLGPAQSGKQCLQDIPDPCRMGQGALRVAHTGGRQRRGQPRQTRPGRHRLQQAESPAPQRPRGPHPLLAHRAHKQRKLRNHLKYIAITRIITEYQNFYSNNTEMKN